ncbi:MAG TPA: transcription termination factor NusA [Anaeromyxobacteraceae bacterium]|jgi:N utilization substance protein A|nr:transcription termination factor NusA [Anaeromyxobacteraceae bacterium]
MQPNVNLNLILDQVAKDKGIERPILIQILEEAISQAAKKHFGVERALKAHYDEDKGQIDLFQVLTIVADPTEESPLADPANMVPVSVAREKGIEVEAGDELDFPIYYRPEDEVEARAQDEQWGDLLKLKTYRRSFGRIAAQTAKQVMIQGTRNAERELIFNEYKDRKGEVITGIVRRFERGNVVVDLGRAEAVLPVREQVPRESYRAGDRLQAWVLDVLRESKGPQIILSRASVDLLRKLFEMEVPEIAEGEVVIEAAAREPGGRAKIAVSSRNSDVDPVGACVGMKGSRVQAVVQELRGEKIDIVPWHEDPARFVCNALAPAEVSRVLLDDQNRAMEIIVPDDQLSLAIGRRGQNVRLASQLTGWKLDINSESRVKEMHEFAIQSFTAIGIPEQTQEMLYAHGFRKAQEIASASLEMLTQFPGFTMDMIPDLQKRAREQAIVDAEEEIRLETEREQARLAEARRHPDSLSQDERLARVRGVGEKTIEQLKSAGYPTVESIHNEADVMRLGESSALGVKKARQIKHAVGVYLEEEARLRAELDAERAKSPI